MSKPITGACQCGANRYVISEEIPQELTRCTCSFCSSHGSIYAYFKPEQVEMKTSSDGLVDFRWNTEMVAQYFCANCHCHVYSDSPAFNRDGSWDEKNRRFAMNALLFSDFDAHKHPTTVIDGKNLW